MALATLLIAFLVGAAFNPSAVIATRQRLSEVLPDVFAKQPTAPRSAATVVVSGAEKAQAHDLYLKGRLEWNQRTPESLNQALDYFTQAIVHDPGNAEAYAGLADTYDLLREYSTLPDSDAYQRAIAAARKAVELDDSLPDAHRALAFAEYYGNWDFIDGEKEFRRAIELNPRDSLAHKWYANAIFLQDRNAESLKEIGIAQELDPSSLSLAADKGQMLFYSGKRDEGISTLKEVEHAAPGLSSAHLYLMRIAYHLRDYPAFLAEGKALAESRNDPVLREIVASARAGYLRGGERGLLEGLYAKQKEYYLAGKFSGALLASTCDRMGKKQEELKLVEEAVSNHDLNGLTAHFPLLKDEPEYQALLKTIHFPQAGQPPIPSPPQTQEINPLRAASSLH